MIDSLTTPALLQPSSDAVAVFGRHALSANKQVDYKTAMPMLRPNYFDFNFGMGAAWLLLLAFAAFVFLAQYKKIMAAAYYLFNFKKYLKFQHAQQRFSSFIFGCFALTSLAMMAANMWHAQQAQVHLGIAFLWSLLALTLYFLLKYFVCFLIEAVTQQRMFMLNLLTAGTNVFFALCFLLIPLFFVQTLVSAVYVQSIIYAQALAAGVFLLLYFLKTMTIFISDRISLFFWMVYFSAVEVFPLAAAYKIIAGY